MKRFLGLCALLSITLATTGCFSLVGVHRDESTCRLKIINVIAPTEVKDFRYFAAIYDDDLNDKHFGLLQLASWESDW